jgi:enoyl-CoA hydratase/carnithine racemase
MYMSSLIYEKKGRIAVITLNRPEVMNAIDPEMQQLLAEAWKDFAYDPEVWVAILTGAGDKAFCTGSDLKKTMPPKESFAQLTLGGKANKEFLPPLNQWKPIICAVNGYAIGGGLELALCCDLIIGSEKSQYGLSEVKIGSMPGIGGTQRLPRRIPYSAAMKMLLTGDRIDANEAYRLGLITEVVPQDQLLEAAEKLAQKICDNAPLSVRAVKMAVNRGLEMSLEQGLEFENFAWGMLRDTKDRIEGRVAFAEKRKPEYKGE